MKMTQRQLSLLKEAAQSFQEADCGMPESAPRGAIDDWEEIMSELEQEEKRKFSEMAEFCLKMLALMCAMFLLGVLFGAKAYGAEKECIRVEVVNNRMKHMSQVISRLTYENELLRKGKLKAYMALHKNGGHNERRMETLPGHGSVRIRRSSAISKRQEESPQGGI